MTRSISGKSGARFSVRKCANAEDGKKRFFMLHEEKLKPCRL
ncbi:hypothetical protein L905_01965 [Agrobacterium sp. TS43]|nr:hypothetical protein L906_05035 [Agrobacterium sp. TS45]KVK65621.1 hypothetical protein L907_05035 [Agrobacterium sp. C13]KVK71503.1 hypothetical protein L905_01965 [Agrobacterium sp. TS43]